MTEPVESPAPATKADLERCLDDAWNRLWQRIDTFDPGQLDGPADPAGWTAKDHLGHLATWERSMTFLLRGRPRHEGLGVAEELYLTGDDDAINAAIQARTKDRSLEDVLVDLRATHQRLRSQVAAMTDEELQRPYAYFLPDEPGKDSGEPILSRISGNGDRHFAEHLGYIEIIIVGD